MLQSTYFWLTRRDKTSHCAEQIRRGFSRAETLPAAREQIDSYLAAEPVNERPAALLRLLAALDRAPESNISFYRQHVRTLCSVPEPASGAPDLAVLQAAARGMRDSTRQQADRLLERAAEHAAAGHQDQADAAFWAAADRWKQVAVADAPELIALHRTAALSHAAAGRFDLLAEVLLGAPQCMQSFRRADEPFIRTLCRLAEQPAAQRVEGPLTAGLLRAAAVGADDASLVWTIRQALRKLRLATPRPSTRQGWERRLRAIPALPSVALARAQRWAESLSHLPQDQKARPLEQLRAIDQLPWGIGKRPAAAADQRAELARLRACLDGACWGLDTAKKSIQEYYAEVLRRQQQTGNVLLLDGPTGVGKTTLITEGLGRALDMPVVVIPLNGQSEATWITGLGEGYTGFSLGKIASELIRAHSDEVIFYFDEVCKIDNRRSTSLSDKLQNLCDPAYVRRFADELLTGVPLDLSRCFFVFACNDSTKIDPVLLTRMRNRIKISGMSRQDKFEAMQRFMVRRTLADVGFQPQDLSIDSEILRDQVDRHDDEENMRSVGRALSTLIRRVNLEVMESQVDLPIRLRLEADRTVSIHAARSAGRLQALEQALATSITHPALRATLQEYQDVLPSLPILNLDNREITDAQLSEIVDLLAAGPSQLICLSLSGNRLTHLEPLSRLPGLQTLLAADNFLVDDIPALDSLINLTYLALHGNGFEKIPQSVRRLRPATTLTLDVALRAGLADQPQDLSAVEGLVHQLQAQPIWHHPRMF